MKKTEQFSMKLYACIADAIQNQESEFYLGEDALDDKNATDFFNALANLMPATLYNRLTGNDLDLLAFNHAANRMAFQYLKVSKEN